MNVCIPIEKDEGLKTKVYGHFGSAPYFAFYDSEEKTLEIVSNRDRDHAHGQCNPLAALAGRQVGILVTGGIGARAVERLNSLGIRVCRADAGSTIEDVLSALKGDGLVEILIQDACSHHHSCS